MSDTNNYKVHHLAKGLSAAAVWLFFLSFGVGTLLLILQAIDGKGNGYYIPGYFYLLAAVFVNTIAFFILVINALAFPLYRRLLLMRASLLLANIPIAILYCYIVFEIL